MTNEETTKEELYQEAQDLDIDGRSSMNKDELADAVEAEKNGGTTGEPLDPQDIPDSDSGGNVSNPEANNLGERHPDAENRGDEDPTQLGTGGAPQQ